MLHATVLLNASQKVRGFAARILRLGTAVAGKVGGAIETVRFYGRHAFTPRTRRVVAAVAMVAVPALLFAGGFAQAQGAFITGMAGTVALLLANILQIITSFFGWLLVTVIGALIWVAQYNGFITSPAVVNGWVLVRDIVNMFFVIFLLMMAFGIMLNVDKYASMNPGKEIVKLATAAILVNFSRTICGLLIDLSQVVMLTFVYGFKEAAGKNFLDAFQITATLQSLNADPEAAALGGTLAFRVTVSMMLALFMTWTALGVVTVMTVMLAVRIAHLWVLVAISPIAFLPKGIVGKLDGMIGQWWKDFTGALAFGPLMAFFLWLSLVSVAGGQLTSPGSGFATVDYGAEAGALASDTANGDIGLTEAFKDSNIQAFIIAIALLTMGTKQAHSMAGAISTDATKVMDGAKKYGKKTLSSFTSKEGLGRRIFGGGASLAASIPYTGGYVRDEEGIRRAVSASSRVEGFMAKRTELAEDKSRLKDEKSKMSEARRLRLIGKGGEADKLEKEVLDRGAKSLSARPKEELRKIMNNQGASQLSRQQAMKALADMGDDSLKGKGAEITALAASVGGNEDFERTVRDALKAKGDTDAGIKKSSDVADMFEQMSAGQVSNQFEKIMDGLAVGSDGKRKQTHAVDKLLAVDKQDFDSDKFKAKGKVKDALLVAAESEQDSALKKKLLDKYQALVGTPPPPNKLDEAKIAVREMESKRVKGEAKDVFAGKAEYSPRDVAAAEILTSGPSSKATVEQTEILKNLQARLKRGDAIDSQMLSELDTAMDAFRDIGLNDNTQRGFVDDNGNDVSNLALVEQSAMFKNLQQARGRMLAPPAQFAQMTQSQRDDFNKKRAEDVANMLQVSTVGLEDAKKGGGGDDRKVNVVVAKKASTGLQGSISDIDRVTGPTVEAGERNKAVLKAVKQGTAAIDAMLSRGNAPKVLQDDLAALKKELKRLKDAKDPADQAALMQNVKDQMGKMQKRLG